MKRFSTNLRFVVAVFSLCVSTFAQAADKSLVAPLAEFQKYYRKIVGRDVEPNLVRFAINPKISSSGKDAYTIRSDGNGVCLTGSNLRSVYYALYDLLERRGGCRYFWDGDFVPKKSRIDFSGLDIKEEARFEYRAIRYFAHRGLTRFQAEHWGMDDWKKEIDWCLKRRLNVMMLRIGQDDLFQRAFPGEVSYPDPAVDLPGHGKGFDNRTLFWSLEYRGKLRRDVQRYALDRGMMVPEDFGTMTHWYSPTPEDFLNKFNPPFLPQASKSYSQRNGLVWDIRDDKWVDKYWQLTRQAVSDYSRPGPGLLHTIGLGERMCYTNRAENLKLKMLALNKFFSRAERDYPDSKILLAGWDFYFTWYPQEVQKLVATLDPKRYIIWDYEGDAQTNDGIGMKRGESNDFTKWGLVGKFPYTFSSFLAYESSLDMRANYPLIERRQKLVQNDPFCAGYLFWPESSHTDTLYLRHFTVNAWSKDAVGIKSILPEFCRDRYGDDAARWQSVWEKVVPLSMIFGWEGNYFRNALCHELFLWPKIGRDLYNNPSKWTEGMAAPLSAAPGIFNALSQFDWKRTTFTERDAIDLARTTADRFIVGAHGKLVKAYHAWKAGKASGDDVARLARAFRALVDGITDVLALHTDFSLAESYDRLDAIEKIRNPNFAKVLIENATCGYCASHQYEAAEYWYKGIAHHFTDDLIRRIQSGDRSNLGPYPEYPAYRDEHLFAKPLSEMRPKLPRTQANYVRVMTNLAEAAEIILRINVDR